VVKQQKWRWAGHVARMNYNRWTKRLTDWYPKNDKQGRKRLDTRWKDEIEWFAGVAWQRIAQDRQLWKELRKAFVQQWTYNGSCCWWWYSNATCMSVGLKLFNICKKHIARDNGLISMFWTLYVRELNVEWRFQNKKMKRNHLEIT